jgi:hypothetical protein
MLRGWNRLEILSINLILINQKLVNFFKCLYQLWKINLIQWLNLKLYKLSLPRPIFLYKKLINKSELIILKNYKR